MSDRTVYITKFDLERLEDLLAVAGEFRYRDRADLKELEEELDNCKVVESSDIPPDVVTMNSRVRLRDLATEEEMVFTLVFPKDSDISAGKLSVVSPIGTAILGYAVGDTVEWRVPAGVRRIRIEELLYQPEAAGDFHL
jgi:regulator of nucleoside diphosphate kinase